MSAYRAYIGLFASILLLFTACHSPFRGSPSVQDALNQLDHTIAQESEITAQKELRLSELKSKLARSSNPSTKFDVLDKIYYEYARYNLDSALVYVHIKEDLAIETGDRTNLNYALMDKAERYLISGMFYSAKAVLESITLDENATPWRRMTYYRLLISLYHNLNILNKDPELDDNYDRLEHYYRNQIFDAADSSMLYYHTYWAENDMENAHPEVARMRLEKFSRAHNLTHDELSILNYVIAKTYRMEGKNDLALTHYAISANYDLIDGVKASRSLIQTARFSMLKGQTEQAFSYITRAYEDASQVDARVCLEEISQFMPEVISSYAQMNRRRMKDISLIVLLLGLIVVVLLVSFYFVRRYQGKLLKANKVIKIINEDLERNLLKTKEANDIKDYYLGQYLSMFSSLINSLEEYRSQLRNIAKGRDMDEIIQELRSDDFIDTKREMLYREFDYTFLGIFPNFVAQLNDLLKEDQHIGENLPSGKLNNELRIFALIRLGVNESALIARFLKKSPSTIYNYRVKLRNASIYPNDEFEKRLMEIE